MRDGTPSGLSTTSTARAVFQMRHVFDRHDAADDALVAVTAGHLVARLQLALHRDEHLDHLHHAGRQFVAAAQLFDLVGEALVETLTWTRRTACAGASISPIAFSLRSPICHH